MPMACALILGLQAIVIAAGPLDAAAAQADLEAHGLEAHGSAGQRVLTPDSSTEVPETGPGLRRLLHGCHRGRCAPT